MSGEILFGMIGLAIGLILLIKLVMKGVNIFIVAFICSAIVAISGGLNLYDAFAGTYMDGFSTFLRNNWLMFLAGTLMGKAMEITGGAQSIAKVLVKILGKEKAIISIPVACGILAYGGVSAFVVAFAVYTIALEVFREADLPRRFIPAALCFGASTFGMVSPGAVQIHNTIPASVLGTDIMAGRVVGFISIGVMLILGSIILCAMVMKEKAAGGHFIERAGEYGEEAIAVEAANDEIEKTNALPNPGIAIVPLVVTISTINLKILPVEAGVLAGAIVAVILMNKHVNNSKLMDNAGEAFKTSIISITNTCAVVAFGAVVQASAAFPTIIEAMVNIPGPPTVGIAVGTTAIAGISGSASGGLGIASELLGPIYMQQGVAPAIIHRVMTLSSASLDSLPHNGYIVTVTNGLCGESHKNAYGPIFWTTVVVPAIGTIVGVILFALFPELP